MGYNVYYEGKLFVDPKDQQKMYEAMCRLNDQDHLKRGGTFSPDGEERPAGMNFNPYKWFSWVAPNYPDRFTTPIEILEELGFAVSVVPTEPYEAWELSYDNKMGQEELFLHAIAPYVKFGMITASGEDNNRWAYQFENGNIYDMVAEIRWVDVHGNGRVATDEEIKGSADAFGIEVANG